MGNNVHIDLSVIPIQRTSCKHITIFKAAAVNFGDVPPCATRYIIKIPEIFFFVDYCAPSLSPYIKIGVLSRNPNYD